MDIFASLPQVQDIFNQISTAIFPYYFHVFSFLRDYFFPVIVLYYIRV
jgi:hypothetical protein